MSQDTSSSDEDNKQTQTKEHTPAGDTNELDKGSAGQGNKFGCPYPDKPLGKEIEPPDDREDDVTEMRDDEEDNDVIVNSEIQKLFEQAELGLIKGKKELNEAFEGFDRKAEDCDEAESIWAGTKRKVGEASAIDEVGAIYGSQDVTQTECSESDPDQMINDNEPSYAGRYGAAIGTGYITGLSQVQEARTGSIRRAAEMEYDGHKIQKLCGIFGCNGPGLERVNQGSEI